MLIKRRTPVESVGDGKSWIALSLAGSGKIPFESTITPRNLTEVTQNLHFFSLSLTPARSRRFRTFRFIMFISVPLINQDIINHADHTLHAFQNSCHLILEKLWCRCNAEGKTAVVVPTERGYESCELFTFLRELHLVEARGTIQFLEYICFPQLTKDLVHCVQNVMFPLDHLVQLHQVHAEAVPPR